MAKRDERIEAELKRLKTLVYVLLGIIGAGVVGVLIAVFTIVGAVQDARAKVDAVGQRVENLGDRLSDRIKDRLDDRLDELRSR
ncbi:MAG TPA: hypothetical protein VIF43_00885 [Patescibacteria group bacterium]|jgi:hypothetical protein